MRAGEDRNEKVIEKRERDRTTDSEEGGDKKHPKSGGFFSLVIYLPRFCLSFSFLSASETSSSSMGETVTKTCQSISPHLSNSRLQHMCVLV